MTSPLLLLLRFGPSTRFVVLQRIAFSIVALSSALSLTGCTAVKVKLGMRVYLAKTQVSSIQAALPNGPGIAPGEKSPLVVSVTEPDGKTLLTEGKGGGKVMWKDLQVAATVATVNQKGVLTLPHDPRKSEGQVVHVTITVPSHPELKTELDVPVRYNYKFASNFSGTPGASGMDGTDGMDGSPGSMGSIDPNNPSPGGDGGNGTDGSNGGDGGPGGDAPAVQIRATVHQVAGDHPLLQVAVTAAGHQRFYLVDRQGGSLTVTADGGPGGSGGRGGRGGRGGMGGSGSPSGSNGRDGSDGRSGSDGPQGRGGSITVTYDPQAKPYLNLIHLSNKNGPTPVFREETVAALW
jgi:hypothetical protein